MSRSRLSNAPRLSRSCAAAALALCLLPAQSGQTAPTPEPGGTGGGDRRSLAGDMMKLFGADPNAPGPDAHPARRLAARRAEGMHRQAELLGKTSPMEGVSIFAEAHQWVAERLEEQEEAAVLKHNYARVSQWSAQLPEGSAGLDVMMLFDRKTGEVVVCFEKDFWQGNHAMIRGAYPRDSYEHKTKFSYKQFGELFINYERLHPLEEHEQPTDKGREYLRRAAGPIVDSAEALKEQMEYEQLLRRPHGPALIQGPIEYTVDPEYTRERMEQDLKEMKERARAVVEYEERRQRRRMTNRLGGVALGGEVKFPAGAVPEVLYAARGRLYARSGGKDFLVEGVSPADFAVFLRGAVLAERPPQLSIGTEPSERAGYQKVFYSGAVRNTAVGEAMLRADLKLKGVLAGIGMGPGGRRVGGTQDFLWSFPSPEGLRWIRLWLTGGEVSMSPDGGRLRAASPRMRLNYELAVRDRPEADPEVERFVEQFNRRWTEVAADVPEFRRLEELSVAAALARWAGTSGCVVSPELWVLPPRFGRTPEYVPGYLTIGGPGLVGSGGVSLLGDAAHGPGLGVVLPFAAAGVEPGEEGRGAGLIVLAAFVVVGLLGFGLLPGLLIRRALPTLSRRRLFARSLRIWVSTLALLWLAYVLVSALAGGRLLGPSDTEFLCLLALLALPPALLYLFVGRELKRAGGGQRPGAAAVWLGLPAAGLCAVVALALLSAGANMFLLSGEGVTPARMRAAEVLAAPLEVAARPWLALSQGSLHRVPESVLRATRYRFYLPEEGERFDARMLAVDQLMQRVTGEAGTIPLPVPDASFGPPGSPLALTVVTGPGFESKRVVLSVTGEPPY